MPHRIEDLRATLRELEAELTGLETLDAESRELLETAAAEIQEALAKAEPAADSASDPNAASGASETWTDKLYGLASDFEQSHPTLSRLVGNVASALAQLGI
jgi:hypothetical protein